jgi:hypothetical protein
MKAFSLIAAAAAVAVLAGCGGGSATPLTTGSPLPTGGGEGSTAISVTPSPTTTHHRLTSREAARRHPGVCDPSLWRAIYHAYRLHVVAACKTVTGTVESVRSEPDGDVHVLLKLLANRSGLLNGGNLTGTDGDLVAEIICVGTVTQADAESACAGHVNQVAVPSAGERIRISGTYVLDADHGWMEIHPVSSLSVLSAAAPPPAPAPAPTTAAPPPPPPPSGCYPKTSSGNCYEPGEFCPEADAGMRGVAGDGEAIICENNNGLRWEPA